MSLDSFTHRDGKFMDILVVVVVVAVAAIMLPHSTAPVAYLGPRVNDMMMAR